MSTVIAVFSDEAGLDEAVSALHELDVDDGALSILGCPGREDVPAPSPQAATRPAPHSDSRNAGVTVSADRATPSTLAAVRAELGDRITDDAQLRHYASVLAYGGRILSLRVSKADVDGIVHALHAHGADQVDQDIH